MELYQKKNPRLRSRGVRGKASKLGAALLAFGLVTACASNSSDGGQSQSQSQAPGSQEPSQSSSGSDRDGGSVVVGMQSMEVPTDMIRYRATIDLMVGMTMYDTLYRVLSDGSIQPWLAQETEVSEDGLTVTITLPTGITFTDGTPLNAEAVKWNFDTRMNDDQFILGNQLEPVTGVEAPSEDTVVISLERPMATLPAILSSPAFGIESPAANEKFPEPTDYADNAVGSGPFKLKGKPSSSAIELVRNEDYWKGAPHLENLTFRLMKDPSAQAAAVQSGDIQMGTLMLESQYPVFEKDPKVKVIFNSDEVSRPSYVFLNESNPLLASKEVRQALFYALDLNAFVPVTRGLGAVTDSMLPPSVFGHAKTNPYTQDVDKAKQLLADAGVEPGTELHILTYESGTNSDYVQILKQQWDAIGFNTVIDTGDHAAWTDVLHDLSNADWQLGITPTSPQYPDGEAILFRYIYGPSPSNYGHYNNDRVNELMDEQTGTSDPEKRLEMFTEIQKLVFDDAGLLPLPATKSYIITSPKLQDLGVNGSGQYYFENAWLEK